MSHGELTKLDELRDSGVLSAAEVGAGKARLLGLAEMHDKGFVTDAEFSTELAGFDALVELHARGDPKFAAEKARLLGLRTPSVPTGTPPTVSRTTSKVAPTARKAAPSKPKEKRKKLSRAARISWAVLAVVVLVVVVVQVIISSGPSGPPTTASRLASWETSVRPTLTSVLGDLSSINSATSGNLNMSALGSACKSLLSDSVNGLLYTNAGPDAGLNRDLYNTLSDYATAGRECAAFVKSGDTSQLQDSVNEVESGNTAEDKVYNESQQALGWNPNG